jgi:hypothetical protein
MPPIEIILGFSGFILNGLGLILLISLYLMPNKTMRLKTQ